MGFKVTIRRNGAVCGEAHYKAEAVAAGMADKATKANPSVSAAVTRCNPGCSVCSGTKTNRRKPAARRRNPMSSITASERGQTVARRIRSALAGVPGMKVTKVSVDAMPGYETAYFEVDYAGSGYEATTLVERALGVGPSDLSLENDFGDAFGFTVMSSALHNPRRRARAVTRRHNGADPFAAVRRAVKKEVSRYAEEGGTFATQRLMDAAYRVYNKHMTETGVQLPVEVVTAEIVAARTQAEDLHRAQTQSELRRLAGAEREAARHRFPRRNGTTARAVRAGKSVSGGKLWHVLKGNVLIGTVSHSPITDYVAIPYGHEGGKYGYFSTLDEAVADCEARHIGGRATRRNGTSAGEMAAGRSMAYSNLFRNNGARPTFDAVRKRIFKEFGEAGWTLSSPTLKVLHATSPDGKCRAWFKAQSIYYTKGGGTHELGTAHSVTQNFDLRDVPPGGFVRWFEKNWCGPTRTNPTRRRASRSSRIPRRRNSGSNVMTEAQAKTVIRQLAGTLGKLVTMTGATGMYRIERDGHPALTFKIKGSKKANVVTIILMPSDTYTLQFAKMAGRTKFYEMTPTGEFSDIYAEQLQPTFERFTGLYLSL